MNRSKFMGGVIGALLATSATGDEFEYGASIGIGSSDNITRVPTDEVSETIAIAGLDLRLFREGRSIDANVDVDLAYFDYRDNTFENEVLGTAFADFRADIVPDRFQWILTDTFGQLTLDPFQAMTPANRENVNYFTTGPDFSVRLGSQGRLTTFGRFAASSFEESNFDDERLLGGVSLARELSPNRVVSLNVVTERVEFDDTDSGSNHDRTSEFLRYELDGARTRMVVDAGYTEIHDFNATNSGPLLEVEIVRDISESSSVTLRGGVRTSDAASSRIDDSTQSSSTQSRCMPSSSDSSSSTDLFETRHAMLCWQFDAQRTNIMLWARYEEDKYERESRLDRKGEVYQALFERHLTPRVTLSAQATLFSSDFEATNQQDDETGFSLYLSWNAIGRFYIEIVGEIFNRDSTNQLTEFEETRAFLRLAWRDRSVSSEAG